MEKEKKKIPSAIGTTTTKLIPPQNLNECPFFKVETALLLGN